MGYDRDPRDTDRQDYASEYRSPGARSYAAGRDGDRDRYGAPRDQPERFDRGYAQSGSPGGGQARYARGDEYHGSYASDGRRFEDVGDRRDWDDDDRRAATMGYRPEGPRAPERHRDPAPRDTRAGQSPDDRGFLARAGDEVRSWFGDDEAERRRDQDARFDEHDHPAGHRDGGHHDRDYHSWRRGQIAALDRDYEEYRNENRSRFENEFSSWRSTRQGQRDSLNKVEEHMDVVGSDGVHVGTVDKVRGDRILLTRNDADAGGRHHSIPSRWLQTVDDKVTLSKTADDAKREWRDEERNQAMFGDDLAKAGPAKAGRPNEDDGADDRGHILGKSFSGTY